MSSIYVKQICAQLASNTTIEIRNYLDCDLLFEGAVAAIPSELLLLEIVKFQTQNNRYVTLIRKMYKDKKLKQEHKDLGEMINSLSYRYGFSWASDKYMANALHTTEKSLKQRISKLKKEQYILVAIVTYHGFFSKKKKKARDMALNYKKAQEEN